MLQPSKKCGQKPTTGTYLINDHPQQLKNPILMEILNQFHVEFRNPRSASFSCAACRHGKRPGGFFVHLSEAEAHVRNNYGVSEDIHSSINLPEARQSLRPFKCKFCKSNQLFPSELNLDEHIKSIHGSFFASQPARFSRRICRFCFNPLERDQECIECKLLIKSFSQEQSNSISPNFPLKILFAICVLILAVLLGLLRQ